MSQAIHLDDVVDTLVARTGLARADIMARITDIVASFNGLLTEVGAALILGDKLGMEPVKQDMGKKARTWTVAQVLVANDKETVNNLQATVVSATARTTNNGKPLLDVKLGDDSTKDLLSFTYWEPKTTLDAGDTIRLTRAYTDTDSYQDPSGAPITKRVIKLSKAFTGGQYGDQPAGDVIKITGTSKITSTVPNALDHAITEANVIHAAPAAAKPSTSKWAKAPPADDRGKSLAALYAVFDAFSGQLIPMLADTDLALLQEIEAMPVKNDFPKLKALYAVFDRNSAKIMAAGFLDEPSIDTLQLVESFEGIQ